MSEHGHKNTNKTGKERETNVRACSQQMHWQLEKREGKSHAPEHALEKKNTRFL